MHKVDQIVINAVKAHRADAEKAGAFSGPDQEIPVIVKALAGLPEAEVAMAFYNHIRLHLIEDKGDEPEAAKPARKPRASKGAK